MRDINIFIAGAKNLKELRDAIRVLCMNLNNELRDEYSAITYIETYETLPNYVSKEGPQETYNEYIRTKADIVLFILHNNCGSITRDEFYVAYESFIRKKRPPRIYVFKSSLCEADEAVTELERLLTGVNQYYIEYDTEADLKDMIQREIRDYASMLKRKKTRNISLWAVPAVLVICVLIGFLLSHINLYNLATFYEKSGNVIKAANYYYESGLDYIKTNPSRAYDCFIKAANYQHNNAADKLLEGADSLMRAEDYIKAYEYYKVLYEIGRIDEFPAGLCLCKSGRVREGRNLIRLAASKGNKDAIKLLASMKDSEY